MPPVSSDSVLPAVVRRLSRTRRVRRVAQGAVQDLIRAGLVLAVVALAFRSVLGLALVLSLGIVLARGVWTWARTHPDPLGWDRRLGLRDALPTWLALRGRPGDPAMFDWLERRLGGQLADRDLAAASARPPALRLRPWRWLLAVIAVLLVLRWFGWLPFREGPLELAGGRSGTATASRDGASDAGAEGPAEGPA